MIWIISKAIHIACMLTHSDQIIFCPHLDTLESERGAVNNQAHNRCAPGLFQDSWTKMTVLMDSLLYVYLFIYHTFTEHLLCAMYSSIKKIKPRLPSRAHNPAALKRPCSGDCSGRESVILWEGFWPLVKAEVDFKGLVQLAWQGWEHSP